MSIGRAHVWSVGALALLLTSPATARGQHPESPSAAGYVTALNLGYNLDYAEALAAFREATARDPNNPALYRLAAATVWTQLLFEQGAVTVEDYLGEARAERPRLDAADRLVVTFHTNLDTALRLSASQLRDRPWDPEAHYQVGAAHSLLASYTATIEGRTAGSVGPARRAYREHSRVLDLDPQRTDAALTVGTYRYAIASLPRPMRVLARIAGFSSGRASGLALVEERRRTRATRSPTRSSSSPSSTTARSATTRRCAQSKTCSAGFRATACSGSRKPVPRCVPGRRSAREPPPSEAWRCSRRNHARRPVVRNRAGATSTAPVC